MAKKPRKQALSARLCVWALGSNWDSVVDQATCAPQSRAMFEVLCSQRPRKRLMVEKKDRGRKGKDKKDPDVGKAKVRLREQADGRCRTYVIQALNPTKTELIGRFCTVVDMGYGELRDLAILDA
ncbi:hypothetical protein F5H01DRAFT_319907 [Linnemannia elongata]|nr:hypothetical protein F5H01DRAFT_319907 [Linnemannia elongata]